MSKQIAAMYVIGDRFLVMRLKDGQLFVKDFNDPLASPWQEISLPEAPGQVKADKPDNWLNDGLK